MLDKLRRKSYIKVELRRMLLRSATKSNSTPLFHRYTAQFGLTHLPRRGSRNKIRNRCISSGRTWNVIRKSRYSRFEFRVNAY
jgi:ribosomal protein S14